MNGWEQLFVAALQDLDRAAKELNDVRSRYTRLPDVRPPTIRVSAQLIWPAVAHNSHKVGLTALCRPSHLMQSGCWCSQCYPIYIMAIDRILAVIKQDTGQHPRGLLRALRRLQAAAAWCQARAAGLQRAYEEVVRQQAKAVEVLEAEVAVRAMAGRRP